MTLWYAGSASVLLVVATTTLYQAIARDNDRESDSDLAESIVWLREALAQPGPFEFDPEDWAFDEARVLGDDGRVVYATPRAASLIPPGLVPGQAGVDHRSANGHWYRSLSRRVGGRTYEVAYDRTGEQEVLDRYRRNIGLVLVPSLALSALVGAWIARRGLRPLGEVAATARRIGPAQLDDRIATEGLPAELAELAATFNAMLDRLRESFVRLEQFSADIAHELRTPVHAIRTVAEISLERNSTRAEDREALATCLESADRLAHLIERLLFLARAEDPRRGLAREEVDVVREVEAIREFFEPAAAEAGVRLATDAPGPIPFPLDRALVQRAVGNLLTNAIAHTPPGGEVVVRARRDAAGLVITVTDTGVGVAAEHLPHLFDRFYRVDAARTPGQGHGLGLAITRRIAELHGGQAAAYSSPGAGTSITLTFPDRPN